MAQEPVPGSRSPEQWIKVWVTQGEGCSRGTFCPFTIWWLDLTLALPALNCSTPTGAQSGSIPAPTFQELASWGQTESTQTLPVLGVTPGLEKEMEVGLFEEGFEE